MGELRNLHHHLSRWAAGHVDAGDRPGVHVQLTGVPGGVEPIHLSHRAAEELVRLLELDRVAATGARRTRATSAVDELCIGALRLRAMANRGGVRASHPRTASRGVAAARRIIVSLMRVIDGYAWHIATKGGGDRPLRYLTEDPGPLSVEHLASADQQLAIMELRALDERHPDPGAPGPAASRDAVTLIDEMIFAARPGVRGHVRIFAPAHRGKAVIMGELSDSPGPPFEPDLVVDALTKAYADLAGDDTAWFRYLPRPDEAVEIVRPGQPAEGISLGDLSAILNGPVRRWHAADYTVATLTAAGVRTVLSSESGGGR